MDTVRKPTGSLSGSEARIHRYTEEREALFSLHATRSTQAVRRKNRKPDDIRTPFSRDADRIIHTRAYTRYIDKTQVFYLVENDHITHRVIHVQLVSKIARTIGRSLRLNEDLIEAIALGHDIGHIPYGHFGEAASRPSVRNRESESSRITSRASVSWTRSRTRT